MKRLKLMFIAILIFAYPAISMSETNFTFSESGINSDPSDWLGLDERQVFYKKLSHSEPGNSWVIKIGKGGQIYSIQMPVLGELIAYQRADHGQWVDEVFQHTLPMPPQKSKSKDNTVVDGDIHQAGYYMASDLDEKKQLLPSSVYSPVFAYQFNKAESSVSYITWPQHAHLPRRYAENLVFINQTIKDLGGGVVEISLEYNKWGGKRHEKFSLPWAAFRTKTLPVQIISNRDGSYRKDNRTLRNKKPMPRLKKGSAGGWLALVTSDNPEAQGIGIVYGKAPRLLDGKDSMVSWGSYGPPRNPQVGGTIVAVYRDVTLDVGESLFYRYYVVLGTLADIQAKANQLESSVELKKITMTEGAVARLEICPDADNALTRVCAKDSTPSFYTYQNYIPDAKPLFLLRDVGSGEDMVTDDPYEISFNPTDGSTKYSDLLGWAVPQTMAADSCRYQPLSEAINMIKRKIKVGLHAANLYVLRPSEAGCVSLPVK